MGDALRVQRPSGTSSVRLRRSRRRVLISDARGNGHHLRATWHPESDVFVVSTWRDEVCTGAVRVPAGAAGELAGLIVEGLAEAASLPRRPAPTRGRLVRLDQQVRRWLRRVRRPVTPRG